MRPRATERAEEGTHVGRLDLLDELDAAAGVPVDTAQQGRELSDGWWACFRRVCSGQARTFWDVTGPRHVGFGSALHRQMRRSRARALGVAGGEPGPRRDSQRTL